MTNVVTYPTGTWQNADGLTVRLGRSGQLDAVVGMPVNYGDTQRIEVDIVWDRLPAFTADSAHGQIYGGYPSVALPTGAYIKSAIFTPTTTFTGTGATLNVGLVDKLGADLGTNTGFFSALAVASMALGTISTSTGALINTLLTAPGYIWVTVGTANFTAGQGRLEIEYFQPAPDKNNT